MKNEIFAMVHDDRGHVGPDRSFQVIRGIVLYKGWSLLKKYIKDCPECNKNNLNVRRHRPSGALQPILTPPIPFYTISIDFVTALPTRHIGFDTVAMMCCKYTKRCMYEPGKKTWTREDWAERILTRLQPGDWGIPSVWLSDRDRKFTEGFGRRFFELLGTKMRIPILQLCIVPTQDKLAI